MRNQECRIFCSGFFAFFDSVFFCSAAEGFSATGFFTELHCSESIIVLRGIDPEPQILFV
nr:MAG TPA: hypothetical protein [Bacteriophage sp.]